MVVSSKLRPETMKLPEESRTETLQNIGVGKDFILFKSPKAKIEDEAHSLKSHNRRNNERPITHSVNRNTWNHILYHLDGVGVQNTKSIQKLSSRAKIKSGPHKTT